MPNLADHHASQLVKLLYIGDSGTGKTGSLTSLLSLDYHLRVLDLDNGLDSLVAFARREFPDKLGNVQFETRRDRYNTKGAIKAETFSASAALMTKWTDGSAPADWGPKTIFVIDSLTALGKAAFEWARGLNPGAKDPRQWYFAAQQGLENIIAMLTSEEFNTNLIIISHINLKEMPDSSVKGYPSTIGSALGPTLPKYFNTLIAAQSVGFGKGTKRKILTIPTGVLDLKNPAPFRVEAEYPLESGLASIFTQLTVGEVK